MKSDIKRIGVISGAGKLPVIFARHAREKGIHVVALALKDTASPELEEAAHRTYWLTPNDAGKASLIFLKERLKYVVMTGKVPKDILLKEDFSKNKVMSSLLKDTEDRMDETVLRQAEKILKKFGVTVIGTMEFLPELVSEKKVYTRREPGRDEHEDIAFGARMARAVGRLDIGQTVVVKNKAVIAVEALEGTDAAIRRCGEIGIEGTAVVKLSKEKQDLRYDVPVIGLQTIESAIEAKARVIAMEGGKTLFIEREESIKKADENGISILGI